MSNIHIDYTNKAAVIALAKEMAFVSEMVVYKKPERDNYNITHGSRTDLYNKSEVVWKSTLKTVR